MTSGRSAARRPDAGRTDEPARGRGGRRRDDTRDDAILAAAVDVVAELGVEGMTMDVVAARSGAAKATMYRRWPSKTELLLEVLRFVCRPRATVQDLPTTGTLRGDLLALTDLFSFDEAGKQLRVMAAAVPLLTREPGLSGLVGEMVAEPWVGLCRAVIERARERGEAVTDEVETVARIMPSMAVYRLLIEQQPLSARFFTTLVDQVLVPALTPR
ncbi:TetR/AcrR family transcriptional regulator [Jatrophihabitans fulvus]